MRRRVDPHAYAGTLESMMRSQGKAAAILAKTATAMTDVTGFGLVGHLMTILEASKVGAELDLEALPLLPDALRLSGQGLRSSIWQANSEVAARMTFKQSAKTDLLFDPQTGGGLLACIPEDCLNDTLSLLQAAGEPVWTIGRTSERTEPPRVCRRLLFLREWSHDDKKAKTKIRAGGARARGSDGGRARGRSPLAMGDYCLDFRQDRLLAANAAYLGDAS